VPPVVIPVATPLASKAALPEVVSTSGLPSWPALAIATGTTGVAAALLLVFWLGQEPEDGRPATASAPRPDQNSVTGAEGFGGNLPRSANETAIVSTQRASTSAVKSAGQRVTNASPRQPVEVSREQTGAAEEPSAVVSFDPTRSSATQDAVGPGAAEDAQETESAARLESADPLDALAELPDFVDLPPPAAADESPAIFQIGFVRLQASETVQFDLLGGSGALGERGSFEIEPGETPRSARVLMATRDDEPDAGQILSVARVAVEDQRLTFLWLIDNEVLDAFFLRNCVLRLSVDGRSRNVALRVPDRVGGLFVDVRSGGTTFQGRVPDLPRRASVWLEVSPPAAVLPAYVFDGPLRCEPGDRITLRLRGESQQDLLVLHLAFFARRQGQFTVAVRTLAPDGKRFDPRAAEQRLAALQSQRTLIETQYQNLPEAARTAFQAQYQQQTEALDAQIAVLLELNDACQRLLDAPLAFRVFLRHRDVDVDLIAANPSHVQSG